MSNDIKKISIVGSGTAGLISALMLREAFPKKDIQVISSSKIGIIGVGEGSTEHWAVFMDMCKIPLAELLNETKATHKNGIRFENWTNHTPDYFHSVSFAETMTHFGVYGLYNYLVYNGKTISENTISRAVVENKVRAQNPHTSVNQYHFDTVLLNQYLTKLCQFRGIGFIDAIVQDVYLNSEDGRIESILLDTGETVHADFWLDATGDKRFLISKVSKAEWRSFSNHLQMDSAIPFPTKSDPSGQIRPYTRARAIQNGWVWEIPTQTRRGNGYVYSSAHCSDDQAIKEVSELLGFDVVPNKLIRFHPGHLVEMWVKNCVAVGLASAFVEPIEATSIGGTIQQLRCLIENMSTYKHGYTKVQKVFNQKMTNMMDNILSFVFLHYVSDRIDSSMWRQQQQMQVPEYLQNLFEIWNERPPIYTDIPTTNHEMFHVQNFYHVMQGQKLLKPDLSYELLQAFDLEEKARFLSHEVKINQSNHERIDHAQALREIQV